MLERDGNEVVGGVVTAHGHNPLEVTRRAGEDPELGRGLPEGVRICPGYDRTPLIRAPSARSTRTLLEAMLVASACACCSSCGTSARRSSSR